MKIKSGISIGLLTLLTAFIGCKKQPVVSDNDLAFSTFNTEQKVHLFNDTTKPGCHLKLKFEYPAELADKESLKKLQSMLISSYFGDEYTDLDPKQAAEKYAADYIASYKELEDSYHSTDNSEEEGGNMWMNYEQLSEGKAGFSKGGFLSYGIEIYSYTGGAHGMTTHIFHVIDLKDMTQVKLSDIFEDRNLDNIAELIKQRLAQKVGNGDTAKLDEMGYDVNAIVPTENFYIDDNGITWQYNSYEIAAYAMGSPTVSVDWEDLLIYMKEDCVLKPLVEKLIQQKKQ